MSILHLIICYVIVVIRTFHLIPVNLSCLMSAFLCFLLFLVGLKSTSTHLLTHRPMTLLSGLNEAKARLLRILLRLPKYTILLTSNAILCTIHFRSVHTQYIPVEALSEHSPRSTHVSSLS